MNQVLDLIFQILILIFSVVIHEVSHGAVAYAMGDSTAKNEGRLTLNPINHLDPFGSIILPLLTYLGGGFIFGWAKPVPYNPYNLKIKNMFGLSPEALVGAAGPLSNIAIALVFGFAVRFSGELALPLQFAQISASIAALNLILAFFNLVPIPPLDGSKILFAMLPSGESAMRLRAFFEQYGIILLLIFIFFFSGVILPIAFFAFRLITGL